MKKTALTALMPLLILSPHSRADTIDTSGQEAYEQCGYCHEYDGNSRMPDYPRLAGQTAEYIKKQLRDFRAGRRKGAMQATAELLSDEDINTVAEYFSKQKLAALDTGELSARETKQAAQLVRQGDPERKLPACISCHQTHALGSGTRPRLSGQHAQYLVKQLQAFKDGTRSNDPDGQMSEISRRLSEQEIRAVAAYLAQMQPARPVETTQTYEE